MHFWIDKRSQTCGFSGRHRVPSSLSSSGGGGRRWRGAKPMVTPVHRFQPIECVTGQYAHSHPRRPNRHSCLGPPAYRLDAVVNGVSNTTELPVRAHAVELDSSVFLDLPLDGTGDTPSHLQSPQCERVSKLKCGVWTSIILATSFLAGAKLYYNRNAELEVIVISMMISLLLMAVCAITIYRSKATRDLLSAAVTASPQQPPHHPQTPSLQVIHTSTMEESIQPHPHHIEPPPPPYHIAISLPQQFSQEEMPPPSYDKAVS